VTAGPTTTYVFAGNIAKCRIPPDAFLELLGDRLFLQICMRTKTARRGITPHRSHLPFRHRGSGLRSGNPNTLSLQHHHRDQRLFLVGMGRVAKYSAEVDVIQFRQSAENNFVSWHQRQLAPVTSPPAHPAPILPDTRPPSPWRPSFARLRVPLPAVPPATTFPSESRPGRAGHRDAGRCFPWPDFAVRGTQTVLPPQELFGFIKAGRSD